MYLKTVMFKSKAVTVLFSLFFVTLCFIIFMIISWLSMQKAINLNGIGAPDRELIIQYYNFINSGRIRDQRMINLCSSIDWARFDRQFVKQHIINLLGIPDQHLVRKDLNQELYFYVSFDTDYSEEYHYAFDEFSFDKKENLISTGFNLIDGSPKTKTPKSIDMPKETWNPYWIEIFIWYRLAKTVNYGEHLISVLYDFILYG